MSSILVINVALVSYRQYQTVCYVFDLNTVKTIIFYAFEWKKSAIGNKVKLLKKAFT